MKKISLVLFCLFGLLSFGQKPNDKIKNVKTVEQAAEFVRENTALEAEILDIHSGEDSTELAKKLFTTNTNVILSENGYSYKIVKSIRTVSFRVSYIYIDGSIKSKKSIDSLRTLIIKKYKSGTPFIELVKQYTMDGNPTGDLGWFSEGAMVKDFEKAVKVHKKGEIFTIDVSSNK